MKAIYRHPNNLGSVIEYDFFGTTKSIFVADHKFRIIADMQCLECRNSDEAVRIDVPELNLGTVPFEKFTDEWIAETFPGLRNDGSATANTDMLGNRKAAKMCRGLYFPGLGECSIPNLFQCIVINHEMNGLLALDDEAESVPGYVYKMLSSTARDSKALWYIEKDGSVKYEIAPVNRITNLGTIFPIVELD